MLRMTERIEISFENYVVEKMNKKHHELLCEMKMHDKLSKTM